MALGVTALIAVDALVTVGALLGADVAGGGVAVGVPPHAASNAAPVPIERPRRKCRRVRAMMLHTFRGGATARPFAPFGFADFSIIRKF